MNRDVDSSVLGNEHEMQVSIEHLRKRYSYNPETGEVTRIATGKVVRTLKKDGNKDYMHLQTKGKKILLHRVAWALHYGEWPKGQIDHIDHDGLNNRIANLRDVDWIGNQRNQRLRRSSQSGVIGVTWRKDKKKWKAQIRVPGGQQVFLGYHSTIEEAASARKAGEQRYWV